MEMIRIERVAVCCSVLQCGAVCCSVLQCVAVRCSALQCVLVCCSHAKFLALIRGLRRACVLERIAAKCADSQKMNQSCYILILMSRVTYA